jgi:hypothetical protein
MHRYDLKNHASDSSSSLSFEVTMTNWKNMRMKFRNHPESCKRQAVRQLMEGEDVIDYQRMYEVDSSLRTKQLNQWTLACGNELLLWLPNHIQLQSKSLIIVVFYETLPIFFFEMICG